jgi:hypothetical protein
MHYRDTDVYYEMMACIADDCKKTLIQELQKCNALGLQIDRSCDRQQIGIKFITACIITGDKLKTQFLAAIELTQNGAKGLSEAIGRSLEWPGQTVKTDAKDGIDMPDFKVPIYSKLLYLSTDGESANTGQHSGLWKRLSNEWE